MEQSRVDAFLNVNADKFPSEKILIVKDALSKLDDSKAIIIQSLELKDPVIMLIISILVGSLGVERFILGQVGLGILKLVTCGGFSIWWIVDMVLVMNMTREHNYQKFMNALAMNGISVY